MDNGKGMDYDKMFKMLSTPSGELELDFMTDGYDIRIPTDMWKSTTEPNKSQEGSGMSVPKNEYSLRAYCSILYLKPRMQIILQGQKVETLYIPKTLAKVTHDLYKPASFKGAKGIPITFGYNTKSKEHYGLMMYNKNRLIKAYERVACQRKANMGVGVIGVLECNHLTPIHNKQDFDQSVEYRKKKAEDLGPENSKEKKARIRDFDDMPDLSTCLPAMFSHDTDANKVDCKDIKASLKYDDDDDDDVIDKDMLKKEKISQTTQSSSDYQQNYKGLHLQIMEAMRHLQDKLIELKKIIKQEGVDTKMDNLEYEQWKNCCDSLQNDLEEIKTENLEVSIQDCAALSTEASVTVKGEVSQTLKDESQDEKGQTDKIQSLSESRELRQNLTRLLRSHVPTLELEQVINKVFAQVLDAITPKVASLLTKETKLPDADLFLGVWQIRPFRAPGIEVSVDSGSS
ncbi:MORC family CW-type zinc finger protein 3 [Silurus meridionalis]|nr:MORC family CW-type zinc finger protein 3 [Silurus meridionalis]